MFMFNVLCLIAMLSRGVRHDFENLENLVQHLTVLAGNTDYCLEILRILLELLNQRAHLNGLWPGSED